ncbi:MAG: 50S ribosomal protein L25/general stress protein Ctc [Bacteroidales bacterium]|nr:50S ribosomal protein L25/general stress protein Ctc [Bacteroidales bacterium]
MKQVSLSGSLRENVGKKDAKKLRKEFKVPCVMYGGKEQVHFLTDEKLFLKIVFTPNVYIVNLNIDGKEYNTIIQDMQYHPVTDRILHVDFLQVTDDKPITIAVPVKLTGTAKGVLKGGRLITKARKLKISALLKDLPDEIEINLTNLEIGDSIKISDLFRDGINFLDAARNVVVGVRSARTVIETPEEIAAAAAEEAAEGAEGTDSEKPSDE